MKNIIPKRIPAWLPYLERIERTGPGKYRFYYKGGVLITSLSGLLSIMVYGEHNELSALTLEEIAHAGVPIVFHRRNMSRNCWMFGGFRPDAFDTVTKQIIFRQNDHKRKHISRALLSAKFKSMAWLVKEPNKLDKSMSIEQMRQIEAHHANLYWSSYFKKLNITTNRRAKHSVTSALDAVSKFLSGPILRWITYHHLSPYHGFLHTPTDYPALVYDLMEPYRGMFDKIVFNALREVEKNNSDNLTGIAINAVKQSFQENIYTGLTRQIITRQELLHGIVLSLKNYLDNNQKQFAIPVAEKPNGGRPKNMNFRFYGRSAGKTDFWKVANEISKRID